MDTISRKIARFALDLKYRDLPDDVVYEAKRFLFDSIFDYCLLKYMYFGCNPLPNKLLLQIFLTP